MSTFTEIVADLSFEQRAIALFLVVNGPQTLKDLTPRFSRHRTTVMRWMDGLIIKGLVVGSRKEGKGNAIHYKWIGGQA